MFNVLNNDQASTFFKKNHNKIKVMAASFALAASAMAVMPSAIADDYVIDTKGAHAFVQFRIKHLGYSWLYGRFNEFGGEFTFDEKDPSKNKIVVDLNVASIDSMHAERDKHLRGKKFLDTKQYPTAKFASTAYKATGEKTAELTGNLTLHGVTKPITIAVEHIGGGKDPWGGYRHGFEGSITINPQDFGMELTKHLGPAAGEVELFLSVEGIRK